MYQSLGHVIHHVQDMAQRNTFATIRIHISHQHRRNPYAFYELYTVKRFPADSASLPYVPAHCTRSCLPTLMSQVRARFCDRAPILVFAWGVKSRFRGNGRVLPPGTTCRWGQSFSETRLPSVAEWRLPLTGWHGKVVQTYSNEIVTFPDGRTRRGRLIMWLGACLMGTVTRPPFRAALLCLVC